MANAEKTTDAAGSPPVILGNQSTELGSQAKDASAEEGLAPPPADSNISGKQRRPPIAESLFWDLFRQRTDLRRLSRAQRISQMWFCGFAVFQKGGVRSTEQTQR